MQKKSNFKKTSGKTKKNKKSKFLLIFVCVFVAIVLILGIVLGTIAVVKNKNSVASYGGTTMSAEVANYFVATYKNDFLVLLSRSEVADAEDSPGFWNSTYETGEKYLDLLRQGTLEYIRQIIVKNYLFDKYSSLSSLDKDIIEAALEASVIDNGGSVGAFNELAKEYGFDYSSYSEAVKMLYKARACELIICGTGGSKLKNSTDADIISFRNEYLSEYSHVRLLFISTELTYVLDDNGNRVKENGSYKTRELTDDEKAARLAEIETIRAAIAGTGGVYMGPDMFDEYMRSELYAGMLETRDNGYYFHRDSTVTESFDNQDIVDRSFEMGINEFSEVSVDGGACFIYKLSTSPSDLSVSALQPYFSDFYDNLSDEFLSEQVSLITPSVKIKGELEELDLVLLPYNYVFSPAF